MIICSDAMLLQLPNDPVQVPGVRVAVTTAIVSDHSLVMDAIPHHTVLLTPSDGPPYGEGQPPLESRHQHPQHHVALLIVREEGVAGKAFSVEWLSRIGMSVVLNSITEDILDHDGAAVLIPRETDVRS